MAVTFSTLFQRLGKLFGMAETIRAHQANLRTEYADVISQYSDADMYMVGNLTRDIEARINDSERIVQQIKRDAESTLVEMVDDDLVASYGGGLERKTVPFAIDGLIRQMVDNSSSIDGTTITIGTVTAGSSNVGNGTMVFSGLASQKNAPTVVDYPSIKTELIRAVCVGDANSNIVAENAEQFKVLGQRSENQLDDEWPKGSGLNTTIFATNPAFVNGNAPGQNILRNSNFELFTSNSPDFFTISTGAAGTDVLATSTAYTGSYALEIVGDGSTAVKLIQYLNSDSGSFGRIKPDTPYTISFAIRRNGAASAGNFKVYLTDGVSVLNNADSNRKMEISLAYNLIGGITTSYQLKTLACMTPKSIPKGAYLVIETDTPFNAGCSIYLDHLCIAEMHRQYAGGIAYQIIPGSTRFAYDDEFTCQITNNGEGKFATEFDRFFNMQSLGYALPSDYAGGETIIDGLIS